MRTPLSQTTPGRPGGVARRAPRFPAAGWLLGLALLLVAGAFALRSPSAVKAPPPPAPTAPAPAAARVPSPSPVPPTPAPSTPSAVSVPTRSPVPQAPVPGVFGLAWFHKPPGDGTTAATLAAQAGYIHLTGPADLGYRDKLRQAGYRGPVYEYLGATSVEGPGPYKNAAAPCAADYQALDNTVAWDNADFCTYIHPHESWFLHNGKGERLYDDYFGSGHWGYLMNPGDPGWQAYYYARARDARDTWHYDGLYLDNLDLSLDRARNDMQDSDGQVREYASDAAWQAAAAQWLAGLRAAVGPWALWANLFSHDITETSWDAYAPYLDGAMEESFAVSWLDAWRSPADWTADLARADHWLAQGKGLVMVGQGPQDDAARRDFTLASYLLVAQGTQAFYRYTRYDSYYTALWLYPQYDTARQLGAPSGPRQEIRPGVWRRPFAHGYVEADGTAHTGRLVLSTP